MLFQNLRNLHLLLMSEARAVTTWWANAWLLFNPPAGSLVGLTVVAVVAVVAVVVATAWLLFNPRRVS